MSNGTREFEFGLVMAGAISAGAYTAGVIDFLLEALEAWDAAKTSDAARVPDHAVRIRALSGSSAGAMTAAILVRSLATKVTPVTNVNAPPDAPAADPAQERNEFRNPFYAAWVQSVDIRHLLGGKDLQESRAKVVSILDSTVLAYLGNNVLNVSSAPRSLPPSYITNPIDVFLTTTNLRGVPYGFGLAGQQAGYRHMMTAYADYVHFALAWPSTAPPPLAAGGVDTQAVLLEPARLAPSGAWAAMMNAALASGAFPIGLAPRLLQRKATEYDGRQWQVPEPHALKTVPNHTGEAPHDVPLVLAEQQKIVGDASDPHMLRCTCSSMQALPPTWPDGIRSPAPTSTGADPTYEYTYWNVDGGLMNNEPLELVRRVLAAGGRNPRDGLTADRAVVMVDPFPNGSDVSRDYDLDIDLVKIVLRMFGALKEQARFKPDELALAADPEIYSRFVISPIYIDAAGKTTDPAIASAVMGGFGGFLAESFRRHDFQLGRRNCQRFLQRHFVLPVENPLFESWRSDPALNRNYTFPDGDAKSPAALLAPIIPLMDHLNPDVDRNAEIPLPMRPRATDVDLAALRRGVRERVTLVVPRLIDAVPAIGLRLLLRALWSVAKLVGQSGKIVALVMDKIEREIAVLGR